MAEAPDDLWETELAALRQERDVLRASLAAGGDRRRRSPRCMHVHAALRRGLTSARPCTGCPWAPAKGSLCP
jgi:hypothetical protein